MCNLVVRARNESGRNRLRRREEREEEEIFCFLRQKVSDNSDNHDLPRSIITQELRFYYRSWTDILMGWKCLIWSHFTNRTVIKDSHYGKQYCHNDCPLCESMDINYGYMTVHYVSPWTSIMTSLEFFAKNFPDS